MRNAQTRKRNPLYILWINIRRWCGITGSAELTHRKYYSGVKVCDDWLDYNKFERWCICAGYERGLNLVRKDKGGDYCPENCVFVKRSVANGMRRCVRRMRDGRSARDIIGRDNLGHDRLYAQRVSRRIFVEGMSVRDAVYTGKYKMPRKFSVNRADACKVLPGGIDE